MFEEVQPRTATHHVFQFDGTEQSIADLLDWCGEDGPLAEYVSPDGWRVTNPFMALADIPVRDRDFTIVLSRDPAGPVRIVEDFPSLDALAEKWETI